jgi:hypothetical protein
LNPKNNIFNITKRVLVVVWFVSLFVGFPILSFPTGGLDQAIAGDHETLLKDFRNRTMILKERAAAGDTEDLRRLEQLRVEVEASGIALKNRSALLDEITIIKHLYPPEVLMAHKRSRKATRDDVTPPTLTSLTITPTVIDLSDGAKEITFTASATDDLSGVGKVVIWVDQKMPSGNELIGLYGSFDDDWEDGQVSVTHTFPEYMASQEYRIEEVTVEDGMRNEAVYTSAQLTAMGFPTSFTITGGGPGDSTGPELTSLEITPLVVDLSKGITDVTFTVTAEDDFSGVDAVRVYMDHKMPNGYEFIGLYGSWEDGWEDGQTAESYTFPEYSASTEYRIEKVTTEDNMGNEREYTAAQLGAMGFPISFSVVASGPGDETGPELLSLEINPLVIDLSGWVKDIHFNVTAKDDLSGVDQVVIWVDQKMPSGFELVGLYGSWNDGWEDGETSRAYTFPEYFSPKVYHIERVTLEDEMNNERTYTPSELAEKGFPTSFELVKRAAYPVLSITPSLPLIEVSQIRGTTTFEIGNTGSGAMTWSISDPSVEWLSVSPTSGTGNAVITVAYDANTGGQRSGTFIVTAPGVPNSPQKITVTQHEEKQVLLPPTNLEVRASRNSVKLIWETSVTMNLKGYNIYRSISESGSFSLVSTTSATGNYYIDNDVPDSERVYYYLTSVDAAGNESAPSISQMTFPGKVMLFIPDAQGESGKQVRLPVSIANADGLDMSQVRINVSYDPAVLSAVEIEKTALSADYGWDKAVSQENDAVRATLAGTDVAKTLYGEGALFYILFDVIGSSGQQTELKFDFSKTEFYIRDEFDPLPLHIEDSGVFTVSTVSEGCYFLGDVNGDCQLSKADVDLTLDISVGKLIATKKQRNAADLSGDGHIRANDATLILRLIANKNLAPEQNNAGAPSVTVSIPDNLTVAKGGSVWVPVEISDVAGVMGADVVINYDFSFISATSVRATSITEHFDITMNNERSGQVRVSLNGREGEELSHGSGALFEILFTARSDASLGMTSSISLASVHLNDSYSRDFETSAIQTAINNTAGALTIVEGSGVQQYALTVSKTGTGTGVITSNPAGINCGTTCTQMFDAGTSVTLTASPETGSSFDGWSGSSCSGTGSCTVIMNSDLTVTGMTNSDSTDNRPPVAENATLEAWIGEITSGKLLAKDPDGDTVEFIIVDQPIKGIIVFTDGNTGEFHYIADADPGGTDTFTFKAVDESGLESETATVTVIILPGNQPPIARNVMLVTDMGTAASGTLSANDSDDDSLTFSIVSHPAKGTVNISNPSTGDFVYTPDQGASGTDSFTFIANDTEADSEIATVTITINALLPPGNVHAEAGINSVKLFWEPSANMYLAGYNVYRSESGISGSYIKIATGSARGDFYVDTFNLSKNTPYYYYLTTLDTFGNESDPSDVAMTSVEVGGVNLFIPDARGKKGEQVTLLVNIGNADDLSLCSANLSVKYNESVLKAVEIKKTPLSAEYEWEKDLPSSFVNAVIADETNSDMYGEGSLFYMIFDVVGNEGDSTQLAFQKSGVPGTFLYDCDDITNEVNLELSNGTFTVESSYVPGDLDGDGSVQESDWSLCLEMAVGKIQPTEEQRNACELSGDKYIRSNDCSIIMRLSAGEKLEDIVPNASGKRMAALRSSSVNVRVSDAMIPVSGSAWVPLEINNAAYVTGMEIVLNYNPSLVTVTGARTTALTENFEIEHHLLDTDGQVKVSLIASEGKEIPQGSSGPVLEVQFAAQTNIPDDGKSPLTLANVRLNDTYSRDFASSALQVDVKMDSGTLTIGGGLNDVIRMLKVLAGMDGGGINAEKDVSGDRKIGMEDVIYFIKNAAKLKK